MKLLYSSWMRELDDQAINKIGIPSIVLMENASRAAADFFSEEFPLPKYKNVVVVAGKGNNGGDGIAVGRILHQRGCRVRFFLLADPGTFNPDPAINFKIVENLGLDHSLLKDAGQLDEVFRRHNPHDTFVVDAIFGTGIAKPVKQGLYADVIKAINGSGLPVAAIDIPSGLSESFLPAEGEHIGADVTATFQALKLAHIYPDGSIYCGKIRIIDIGIPKELFNREEYYLELIEPAHFIDLFKPRAVDAHKGHFGHTLTISGSIEKPGAGILSAFSALRSGAGLCTAAVCFENRLAPVTAHPEIMTLVYDKSSDLLARLPEFNTILVGPGLGVTDSTYEIVSLMIKNSAAPLVMDADALTVLQGRTDILKHEREAPLVLTPHPGEFSRLTGLSIADIQRDRIGTSRDFARRCRVYLVLKGHHTIVASPEGRVYINQTGNPGMAAAGSGDVLCGMIAGMISQFWGKHPMDAVLQAAVFTHGYAADLAAAKLGEVSLTAGDIIDYLPQAIMTLDGYKSPFQFA